MDIEDKCFNEGYCASDKGYTKKDNPYKRFTIEWEYWREGNKLGHIDDPWLTNLKKLQSKIKRRERTNQDRNIYQNND